MSAVPAYPKTLLKVKTDWTAKPPLQTVGGAGGTTAMSGMLSVSVEVDVRILPVVPVHVAVSGTA